MNEEQEKAVRNAAILAHRTAEQAEKRATELEAEAVRLREIASEARGQAMTLDPTVTSGDDL